MRTRLMFAFLALLACSILADHTASAAPFCKANPSWWERVEIGCRNKAWIAHDTVQHSWSWGHLKALEWSADTNRLGWRTRIVSVSKGLRYTFESFIPVHGKTSLSVWVRRNGTWGQDTLVSFSDEGLDGNVDFGISGPTTATDEQRKFFLVGDPPAGWPTRGEQYRAYWQARYDEALRAVLRLRHRFAASYL